jgi:hypothetical protein
MLGTRANIHAVANQILLITCYCLCADPSTETEEFDNFIGACPADLRDGRIQHDGKTVDCPKLFDGLANDWIGHNMPEYMKISVMLAIHAVKPGRSRPRKRRFSMRKSLTPDVAIPVTERALACALAARADESEQHAINGIIELADI